MSNIWRRALTIAGTAAASAARSYLRRPRPTDRRPAPEPRRTAGGAPTAPGAATGPGRRAQATGGATEYDVGRLGLPDLAYTPREDDRPDPGEVVWTWVPFEDDPVRGKDRPVLVLAREGARLVVAQMTSKDHDRDRVDEQRWGRHWVDVGTGAWDARGRDSEVRIDRLLWVDPGAVRREGAALDSRRYDAVTDALRAHHRG